MMGWYQGDWGFAGVFGMGMMLLLWGALIWLAVWGIARVTRAEPSHGVPVESARAILDRRFASGEIDAEEYVRTRHALEAPDTHGLTPSSP